MSIAIGTYNVNNLFQRAVLLQAEGMSKKSAPVLEDVQTLTQLLNEDTYEGKTGKSIVDILTRNGFAKNGNAYFTINEINGKLFRKSKGAVVLVAKGREDWVGGPELIREVVSTASTENTGRVIAANPLDVLCFVEVEDRLTLEQFNETILKKLGCEFVHDMGIQGNDPRHINVGICTRYEIRSIRTHIDDMYTTSSGKQQRIFSRDCAEYELALPDGRSLRVLCNHLKSQGYGTVASNDAKRARQAKRVREILSTYDLQKDLVVVLGDFNAWCTHNHSLDELLQTPHLHDVLTSSKYSGPSWTYEDGKSQLDYLLVSQPLFDSLEQVGVERRGIFRKGLSHFPEVTDKTSQASDHALVWAQFAC